MKWRDASRIAEYALGSLAEAEQRALEAEIAASDELKREAAAVLEALAALPLGIAPVSPRRGARAALLSALSSGERFRPFLADLVRWCDLPVPRVREVLARIDEAGAWQPGPLPSVACLPFASGPNAIARDSCFVRMPRGLCFPYHRHAGPEINYVLEGALRDGDGTLYVAGDAMVKAPGSAHECHVPKDADTLIAVVHVGFEFIEKP
jgi:anti-sigma factor ChrR (cupin superfamily)